MEKATYHIPKTLRQWWTKIQHAFLEDFAHRAELLLVLRGQRLQQKETRNAEVWKHRGNRHNSNSRKRQGMNVERRPSSWRSRRHSSSSSMERDPPKRESRRKSSLSEGYFGDEEEHQQVTTFPYSSLARLILMTPRLGIQLHSATYP